jgi:NADPH:quinone reductase-like Zn-dependent oxidoreductase
MVRRLDVRRGDNVLVTAATSNTGLFGLQALVQRGARVVAVTRSGHARAELERLGAAQVIDVESADDLSAVRTVARPMGGFDAVFDPFSDVYFPSVLSVMGLGARYITCGVADQRWVVDEDDVEAMSQWKHVAKALIVKNVTLMGNCLGTTRDLADALRDWCDGRLRVVLDSVHSAGAVRNFLERTFTAPDRFGKAVYLYD